MAAMLLAWGSNTDGECCSGDNSQSAEPKPRCVNGVLRRSLGHAPSVTAVACGKAYTLLLMAGGDVYACGRGREGQLGVELSANCRSSKQPLLISALQPWRISQVSCGCNHSMAVSRCGKAFEWGLLLEESSQGPEDALAARVGGLGRDFTEDLNEREQRIVAESWSRYIMNDGDPSQSEGGLQGEDAIALFKSQSCQRYPVRAPRECTGLEGLHVHMISCGYAHSVALVGSGVMMAHGYNEKGQLGNGVRLPSQHFLQVAAAAASEAAATPSAECRRAIIVSCGLNHNAAILEPGGELVTWGTGTFGQLGLGHRNKESCKPCVVQLHAAAVQVACGDNHTVVLLEGGDVYAFGHRDALGDKSHVERLPQRVRSLRPNAVKSVFAGGNGSFAVVKDDDLAVPEVLHAWGYNQRFQLGRYTGELQLLVAGPTSVPRLPGMNLKSLDAGMYHCVALIDPPTVPILPPDLGDRCFGNASMWSLLDGEVEYDVSIKVSDGDPVGAHRCVLAVRCPSMSAHLKQIEELPNNEAPIRWELDLSKYCASTVRALLEYVYCDYCRAAPDVAATLKLPAEEFFLPRLAACVSAATETQSLGSDVCWVRTAEGKWAQVAAASDPRAAVASTYTQDLLQLVLADGLDSADSFDFVQLRVKQVDSTFTKTVRVARPLLQTAGFFRALLDGGFAEARDLRSGSSGHVEVAADNADAFVLCLQILATGNAGPLIPSTSGEILAVLVEAHRLGFTDAFSASEIALGKLVAEGELETTALEAIARAAQLYDLERLGREAAGH